MKINKKLISLVLAGVISSGFLVGCSSTSDKDESNSGKEKTFVYGTSAYNPSLAGINPHKGYLGWAAIRYGVAETLFKFNDKMELEPWLATDYEIVDDYTMKINLRDDVTFSNGNKMTGDAVKACIESLVRLHDRAPSDLAIVSVDADGQSVTIKSENKVVNLLNYLSDPYAVIIDVSDFDEAGDTCIGTGPFIAKSVTGEEIKLDKNENYWGGEVKLDKVVVKSITDGDTMTMALQNGEIDATQGLPYSSLDLFRENDEYKISSANTSRVYQMAYNYENKDLQNKKVRQAIAKAINKEDFTKTLLNNNGTPAVGAFPSNFSFGNEAVTADTFDLEEAKKLLKEAGYEDTDNDGYVDKDGKNLTLRWLTYPSRMELPLLAESAQATLKEIGIKVDVNNTENTQDYLNKGDYDIYASAFVTAPTGDPQYYITAHLVDGAANNFGHYHNDKVEALTKELRNEFDTKKRSDLAVKIQQEVLNDCGYTYASHLKMSFVMKKNITGFEAHPSDFYEITADTDIE